MKLNLLWVAMVQIQVRRTIDTTHNQRVEDASFEESVFNLHPSFAKYDARRKALSLIMRFLRPCQNERRAPRNEKDASGLQRDGLRERSGKPAGR
jgi:hypothetical protein